MILLDDQSVYARPNSNPATQTRPPCQYPNVANFSANAADALPRPVNTTRKMSPPPLSLYRIPLTFPSILCYNRVAWKRFYDQ